MLIHDLSKPPYKYDLTKESDKVSYENDEASKTRDETNAKCISDRAIGIQGGGIAVI
jgi:hypothetical protein